MFSHMISHEDFVAVAQSRYKVALCRFAIQVGKIDGLLVFSVTNSL